MECELEKRIGAALSAAGAVRSQVLESRDLSKSADASVQDNDRANFDVWCRILGAKGEGETKSSGSRDESAKEDSRSEENRSCEK